MSITLSPALTSILLCTAVHCGNVCSIVSTPLHTPLFKLPNATTGTPTRHHLNPLHHHSNTHLPPLKLPLRHHSNPHYATTQGPGALNLYTKNGPFGPNGMYLTKMIITMMFLRSIKVISGGVGHQLHHPFKLHMINHQWPITCAECEVSSSFTASQTRKSFKMCGHWSFWFWSR